MLFNDHQYLLLGMLVLLLPFIPGSKYLLPAKKLLSNIAYPADGVGIGGCGFGTTLNV